MSQNTGDRARFNRYRTKRRRMRIVRRAAKAEMLASQASKKAA